MCSKRWSRGRGCRGAGTLAGIAVALLTCVAVAGGADTFPAAQIRQNLFDACFLTADEGWVVGDLARLFHTTDAGKTWVRRPTPTGLSFVALACPDRTHLWAVGQQGQIIHSSDAGASWHEQRSGTVKQLLDVAFGDAQHGVAVGDFGTILRTADAGATWMPAAMPHDITLPPEVAETVDPGDVVLYAVSCVDPQHCWIAGEFGVVLTTADGGATWRGQPTGVEASLFGITFADGQRGWAVGLDGTLIATTDGGQAWRRIDVTPPRGFVLALYDIAVRGQVGWAVGNSGLLLRSTDAGATWATVSVPAQMGSRWFRGVALAEDGRGLIVGARGLMLTTHGGTFTASKDQY